MSSPSRRPPASRATALPRLLALALFLAAVPAAAQLPGLKGGGTPSLGGGRPTHVRAVLLADHAAITSGQTFRIGVLFSIEPEWHIYWHNSGEAGFRTTVAWTLPEGFAPGPLQWPAPYRFVEAGDIWTYGYKREVLLWAEVTAPPDLPPGATLDFGAATDWLMCRETCIPGDAAPTLSLRVGDAPVPSPEAARFDRAAAMTPAPLPLGDDGRSPAGAPPLRVTLAPAAAGHGTLRLEATADAAWAHVAAELEGRTLTFFPAEGPLFLNQRSRGTVKPDGGFVVDLPMTAAPAPGQRIEGVLLVPRAPGGADPAVAGSGRAPDFSAHAVAFDVTPAMIAPSLPPSGPEGRNGAAGAAVGVLDGDFREASTGWVARLGLLGQLLLAFVGGLILNIMPCVLPVISLKVLGLVRQGGEDPRRILRLGLVFALGIWVSFMALAVPIAVLVGAGRLVGWGEVFQSPAFLFGMFVVLVVFALSLLGVYEIALPGAAADRLQGAARREGYGGSFFNGCLATVLATPCMAPFIGPAIGFALTQSPATILLLFTAIAAGLAAPYLLLALRPGWMRWLPKPGEWMDGVKALMGLAMLGAAVFPFHVLAERAANIDGAGTRIDAFPTRLLLFTVLLAVAVVVVGRFVTILTPWRRRLALYGAGVLLAAGAYFGLLHAPLGWMAAGKLPDDRIAWVEFSPAALEEQLRAGNTVFVDFTAEWCITCKFNEKFVLETERVRTELNRPGVVAMKADWTRRNPEITEVLSRFGRAGVPFYVVFDPRNPGAPNPLGETITPGQVVAALEAARR